MQATIENDHLVIRVPLEPPTPSASGKTLIVASSHGNMTTTAKVDGKPIIIGLNAFIRPGRGEVVKAELAEGGKS